MAKNLLIAALAVCTLYLAAVAARLENYHYASFLGMCAQYKVESPPQNLQRHKCLHESATRTSPLWHLFFAVTDWY